MDIKNNIRDSFNDIDLSNIDFSRHKQSDNAKWLLEQRYFLNRYDNSIDKIRKENSFEELARRVSRVIAASETKYSGRLNIDWVKTVEKNIYTDIMCHRFLFNSPCLFSAGVGMIEDPDISKIIYCSPDEMMYEDYVQIREERTEEQQLFACFVINIEDSLGGIFDSVKDAAIISKYGGGVGTNFSTLRESGASIRGGNGGKTSGPVPFMETWNTMGSVVVQGGCFTGDTLIATPCGATKIKDLKREDLVYSWDGEYKIKSCTGSWVTKKNAEVWTLTTDKGLKITATPDHPLLLRDSTQGNKEYVKLKDSKGKRIMPFTRYIKKTGNGKTPAYFISLHDGEDTRVPEHILVSRESGVFGEVIHHIDGDHLNNAPNNLVGMSNTEHARLHCEARLEDGTHPFINLSKEAKQRGVDGWKEWYKSLSPEEKESFVYKTTKHMSDENTKRIKEGRHNLVGASNPMKDPEKSKNVRRNGIAHTAWTLINKGLSIEEADWDKSVSESGLYNTRRFKSSTVIKYFGDWDSFKRYVDSNNHKVVDVRFSHYEDTYNVEVPETHNYVVCDKNMSTGIVVSNTRRAALMGMLDVDHPDIGDFMDAKTEDGELSYFNISVAITDEFMEAVNNDTDFDLISRVDGSVVGKVKAKELWDKLCKKAWKRGDPGIFFKDTANQDSLLKLDDKWTISSTNPCGEEPLPDYTSCNLGSINTSEFVKNGEFDFDSFRKQITRSTYYLDLVIDSTSFPLDKIADRTTAIRPLGLGIMGLADTAIKLNLEYGNVRFQSLCEQIGSELASISLITSVGICKEMNKPPFPEAYLVKDMFDIKELTDTGFTVYIDHVLHTIQDDKRFPVSLIHALESIGGNDIATDVYKALSKGLIRNSRRLSIAPTGSISMILDTSAGIEPNFAWHWSRRISAPNHNGGFEIKEYYHPLLTGAMKKEVKSTGHINNNLYVSAHDVSVENHVDIVGIFTKYIDSGISKTVNLPNSATVEDVKKVYERCYELGCKGITVYRDGSRSAQPIETKKKEAKVIKTDDVVKDRPAGVIMGKTFKDTTPWGSLYVTLNYDKDKPFEVFASLGKSGSEMKSMTEALSRVISICLRSGGRLEDITSTLRGISGKEIWTFDCDNESYIRSIPDGIAMLLDKIDGNESSNELKSDAICPECGSPMELVGGCAYCFSCGYSPCK